jgi:hypothetical protein
MFPREHMICGNITCATRQQRKKKKTNEQIMGKRKLGKRSSKEVKQGDENEELGLLFSISSML